MPQCNRGWLILPAEFDGYTYHSQSVQYPGGGQVAESAYIDAVSPQLTGTWTYAVQAEKTGDRWQWAVEFAGDKLTRLSAPPGDFSGSAAANPTRWPATM